MTTKPPQLDERAFARPSWQNNPSRIQEPWAQEIAAKFPSWHCHWSKLLERLELEAPHGWASLHVVPPETMDFEAEDGNWAFRLTLFNREWPMCQGPDWKEPLERALIPLRDLAFALKDIEPKEAT